MNTALETQTTTWNIDPAHSAAEFKVKHMMISYVKGQIGGMQGSLALDEADLSHSRVEASLDAASISTGEPQRDAHLRNADFFDVEKFPSLSFRSTGVTPGDDGELKVKGDLTIHGVTRSVTFSVEGPSAPVKDPYGNTRRGLAATAKISRKDFGLTWSPAIETGGVLIGDEVTISLDVQFVKA